jgi:hypothetical protein
MNDPTRSELLDEYYTVLHQAHAAMRLAMKDSGLSNEEISSKLGKETPTLKTLSFMATEIGCRVELMFTPFSEIGKSKSRPMEEAPLDGTPLLLFARHPDAEVEAPIIGAWRDGNWWAVRFIGEAPCRVIPIAWMHIPEFTDATHAPFHNPGADQ